MKYSPLKVGTLLTLLCCVVSAVAQPTKVVIRAKARDAKFVGATLGVHVVVRNDVTGEILAQGKATGGPGNTKQIMYEPATRGKPLADAATSKFEVVVDIDEPTLVNIEVTAPANRRTGTKKVTTQTWLIPGKHILGDGIIVEIPGFIVDVLSPTTQQYIKLGTITDGQLPLKASVTMACGCVISKGGTWNADDYQVAAIIKRDGERVAEVPLKITETNNIFATELPIAGKGDYEVQVYAYDPAKGNVGLDRINFMVY